MCLGYGWYVLVCSIAHRCQKKVSYSPGTELLAVESCLIRVLGTELVNSVLTAELLTLAPSLFLM